MPNEPLCTPYVVLMEPLCSPIFLPESPIWCCCSTCTSPVLTLILELTL